MVISLPLQPQEEAKLKALADAKGLSAEELVREVLDEILTEASATPVGPFGSATGAALVAAMQASPHKEIDIEPVRTPLPTRKTTL